MKALNYFVILLCFLFGFISFCSAQIVVGKIDAETAEIQTTISRKININQLKEQRDRLLWQQAESANRFNSTIYELNSIIKDFESK